MNPEHLDKNYFEEGGDVMADADNALIKEVDKKEREIEEIHEDPRVGRGIGLTTVEHEQILNNAEKFARTLFFMEDKMPDNYGETGDALKNIFNGPGEWNKFISEFPGLLAVFYKAPIGWKESKERKMFLEYVLKVDRVIRDDETIH